MALAICKISSFDFMVGVVPEGLVAASISPLVVGSLFVSFNV